MGGCSYVREGTEWVEEGRIGEPHRQIVRILAIFDFNFVRNKFYVSLGPFLGLTNAGLFPVFLCV